MGNSEYLVYCYATSVVMSLNLKLDMSLITGSIEREFKGGFLMELMHGCYKGVVVIKGNSLWGSILLNLGI